MHSQKVISLTLEKAEDLKQWIWILYDWNSFENVQELMCMPLEIKAAIRLALSQLVCLLWRNLLFFAPFTLFYLCICQPHSVVFSALQLSTS